MHIQVNMHRKWARCCFGCIVFTFYTRGQCPDHCDITLQPPPYPILIRRRIMDANSYVFCYSVPTGLPVNMNTQLIRPRDRWLSSLTGYLRVVNVKRTYTQLVFSSNEDLYSRNTFNTSSAIWVGKD